jgi:DNA polymerase/3'-5' exonuclease PolX
VSAGGTKLDWFAAAEIAKQLVGDLEGVVARAKTVGSIRRRRPTVSDIEILVEPLQIDTGLFSEPAPDLEVIGRAVQRWGGRILKNGDRFIQVELAGEIHVDLFFCHPPAQWGSLLAIRTGPAELGRHAVTLMTTRGLRHRDGHVERADGTVLPTPREEDFFAAAGLPCLPPARRDDRRAYMPIREARHG